MSEDTFKFQAAMMCIILCCCGGCAEFRQDAASCGGYYLTSLVEHVGHRELKLQHVYLDSNYVIAEATLMRPTRRSRQIIGTRFLVADRKYVDALITSKNAQLLHGKMQKMLIGTAPVTDWQPTLTRPTPHGWMIWPDTLGTTDRDMSLDDLFRLLPTVAGPLAQYPAETVPVEVGGKKLVVYFYYPQNVNTAAFWQEQEYLVDHPVTTTVFKAIVVPPAMIIDTICLPVIGCAYLGALLSHSHDHGP